MYYRHFGLDGPPFGFVPSARELYLSQSHREALAALEWGVLHEPSGFTLLIGETGTGKTTLVKSILARNYAQVLAACVDNPKRGFEGILRDLLRQFHLTAPTTKLDMLAAIDQFLEQPRPGERIVVLIDEAQSLDDDSLEELRLFSNVGADAEKQLHFVLVGQPELIERLMQPRLRQFNDRIGARALLNPLSPEEAHAYMEFRLKAHGGSISQIFERAAAELIIAHSTGIPRRLNVLGHNAMLLAYSAGARKVDLKAARAAISEYENLLGGARAFNRPQPRAGRHWPSLGIAAAATAALACAIVAIIAGSGNHVTDASANFAGDMAVHPRTPALTKVFTPANRDVVQSKLPSGASPATPEPAQRDAVPTVKAPATDSGQASPASNSVPRPAVKVAAADIPAAPQVATSTQRRQIRVRHGDTLQLIAIRYLGSQDRLKSLIDANPQLRNLDLIYPGQILYLPATSALADSASEE